MDNRPVVDQRRHKFFSSLPMESNSPPYDQAGLSDLLGRSKVAEVMVWDFQGQVSRGPWLLPGSPGRLNEKALTPHVALVTSIPRRAREATCRCCR